MNFEYKAQNSTYTFNILRRECFTGCRARLKEISGEFTEVGDCYKIVQGKRNQSRNSSMNSVGSKKSSIRKKNNQIQTRNIISLVENCTQKSVLVSQSQMENMTKGE